MFLSAAARRFVITIPPFSRSRDGELKEPAEEEPENANYYRFDDSFQWSSLAAVGRRCRLSLERKERESRINRDSNFFRAERIVLARTTWTKFEWRFVSQQIIRVDQRGYTWREIVSLFVPYRLRLVSAY